MIRSIANRDARCNVRQRPVVVIDTAEQVRTSRRVLIRHCRRADSPRCTVCSGLWYAPTPDAPIAGCTARRYVWALWHLIPTAAATSGGTE